MRCRRHQKVVIRHLRQGFAEPIGEGLLVIAICAHFVGFIHDDEVPVASQQRFLGILNARNPRNGSDDLVFLLPRVHPVVGAKHIATDDLKALAEFVFEFPLPLEGEIGGRHDKRSLDQTPNFQLFDEKARHDRFAGTWIVGQQEIGCAGV